MTFVRARARHVFSKNLGADDDKFRNLPVVAWPKIKSVATKQGRIANKPVIKSRINVNNLNTVKTHTESKQQHSQ